MLHSTMFLALYRIWIPPGFLVSKHEDGSKDLTPSPKERMLTAPEGRERALRTACVDSMRPDKHPYIPYNPSLIPG